MAIDIVVPQIGEAVSELQIVAWHKQVGDSVRQGEVLFEVDSDKAIVEVQAFADGTLQEIIHGSGSSVLPQQVVARLIPADEAEQTPESPQEEANSVPKVPAVKTTARVTPLAQRIADDLGVEVENITGTGPSGRVTVEDVRSFAEHESMSNSALRASVSPKARRLAKDRGVSLDGISGSGIDGMIVVRDLDKAADRLDSLPVAMSNASGVEDGGALSKLRQRTAERTTASKQQVPHFYLMVDVDMTAVDNLRTYCRKHHEWERQPTYTDILTRACALALAQLPEVNYSYSQGQLVARHAIGVGIAINTPKGLIAASIENADKLNLKQTSDQIRELVDRAREGRLRPNDFTPKSMVISNLGMYGIDTFVAIIDQPDPMILAVGRVAERAVPQDGQVVIKPMCTLTLSVDHRVLDGVQGARFLERIKTLLENPFELLGSNP